MTMARLGLSGIALRRRLRKGILRQLEEAARLVELYGTDAPALFGETQRRHAAYRRSQGAQLAGVIEGRALLTHATLEGWGRKYGPLPIGIARRLVEIFSASASQIADVFLTFQRSEATAFREAALLQTLVSHMSDALFLVERDGTVSYVSPVLETILSFPPQLIVGESVLGKGGIFERLEPRDQDGTPIPADELPAPLALKTGARQHRDAVFIRRMDGTDAVLEIDGVPIFDEEERLRGVVVTAGDRTEAFHKRQELEAAYAELRRMHTKLLSRSRLEAVGGLAESAAHALNNQLNVIALRVDKLKGMPAAKDEVEGIERSVREIAILVGKLQELASAPQYRTPTATDIGGVLEDALALTRSELEAAKIHLEVRRGQTDLVVGDRETLLEFFAALLLGTLDTLREGGDIAIETEQVGDRVFARLLDRAPTLGQEEIGALFEPLAAVPASRVLSLAAGREAVRRWGGEVRVLPREGGGNVFEIEIPAVPPAGIAPRPAPAPTLAPTRGAESVLVLDDDPDNAEMLSDLVEDAGAVAHTALTGARGLELARTTHLDVALVDLLLPDMDGWEVVRQLRALDPAIRIGVVSGLAVGTEEKKEADEVFRKPVSPEGLLRFLGLGS
jgi:CheY-like chemotaxis protein